ALDWQPHEDHRCAPLTFAAKGKTGFTALPANQTGILFTNALAEERALTNQIYLNGSGVAAGDVDGDGLCDLYFCGLERPNALYRNLGNWKFVEVTAEAGVACADQASTGAVFADVDGDGDLDLLVNGFGRGTRLFLNDGQGHFREATAPAGLGGSTGSMSLALADVDGDGFLDLYVANYRATTFRDEPDKKYRVSTANNQYELLAVDGRPVTAPDLRGRFTVDPVSGVLENGEADVLYHNDGHGKFVPLSWTNGDFLDEEGRPIKAPPYDWGLSVMFRDLNEDGAPDIYVCNDFQSEDRIWINDGRGHFRAIPRLALRHTSLFSMGVDFADLDRDGHDEFFVADMLSREHVRRQVQLSERTMPPLRGRAVDGRPQYSRNTLFWNRGDGTYSEVAQFSGVEASDWSWCPVVLDVDLDGFEDLLITTGHGRDAQNIDVARRIDRLKKEKRMSWREQLRLRKLFPKLETPLFAFHNGGALTFEEVGRSWGFDSAQIAQGMCLADLDNDGDLDLAVNCLNGPPLIYRNDSVRPRVAVRLRGLPPNTQGIGAKIKLFGGAVPLQSQEVICGGRYLSGDDPVRTFAAGTLTNEMTIEINWRSSRHSVVQHVRANRVYEIDEAGAKPLSPPSQLKPPPMFVDVSELIRHTHIDEPFDDFQRQPLLPRKLSQLGPGVTWFDVDGDGWEDLIVGSGRGGTLAVFRNDGHGGFILLPGPALGASTTRDQTSVLGWDQAPGRPALLIGSASYEDGLTNGAVVRQYDCATRTISDSLFGEASSTGPLALADVDGDGDLDLFVGGRVISGRYPEPASSLFFRNDGGTLRLDAEASLALAKVGLVSGAIWTDLDGDGLPELALACEGGPIRIFRYQQGKFREATTQLGLGKYPGWWNSVTAGDIDGDGRLDLVAGNWGRNTKYQSHLGESLHLYYGDLYGDGVVELIEAYYDRDRKKIVPWRDWETLSGSFPFIKERYDSFTAFSAAGVSDFLGSRLARMKDQVVTTLDSMVFLNRGDHFEPQPLPMEAQWSPVFGIVVGDLDGDGNEDIFVSQNFFAVSSDTSRYDAGRGLWLKGDGRGGLKAIQGQASGLKIYGEGRGAALCDYDHDGRLDLVVGQNGNTTRLYRNVGARAGLRVRLKGPPGNPYAVGAVVRLIEANGRCGPAHEVHAGGGYWSQDSPSLVLAASGEPKALAVQWPGGASVTVPVPRGTREIVVAPDGKVDAKTQEDGNRK
ncbi:MAG: hypothetical protein DME22_22255, partial [Verrucomicrobia bacterium]